MAEPDYSLAAHPYIPPATNPLESLQGIERYRILKNQTQTSGLEAQQKQIDFDALKNYGDNGDTRVLRGATPELRTGAIAANRNEEENKKDVMSRDANYIKGEQDPELKQYLWDKKTAEYVKKGWVDRATADKYPTPHDGILDNLANGNIGVPEVSNMTGTTAGNEAAARHPYEAQVVRPGETVQYPAVRPNGPLANGTSTPPVLPGGNRAQPFGEPSEAGPAAPRSKNLTDTQATVLPPKPGVAPATPPVDTSNPYSKEVPTVPIGHDLPTGKGIVQPGIDPLRTAAREEGLKKFNTEIEPGAEAAGHTKASLGTMKAELDKGVTTDRLAELKTTVGGFLYAMTKDPVFVKGATGLDVSNQEVFNKESTRMGLTFARQTEGAREAVAAIRIALGANPSLMNTETGNRKIIGIMDQAANYDRERAKAAQAFMQNNDGHLTGFDTWFSNAHPPAAFISKAVPYTVPDRREELQNGVTYEFPLSKDANGKPVMHRGTWNKETNHFDPVE